MHVRVGQRNHLQAGSWHSFLLLPLQLGIRLEVCKGCVRLGRQGSASRLREKAPVWLRCTSNAASFSRFGVVYARETLGAHPRKTYLKPLIGPVSSKYHLVHN